MDYVILSSRFRCSVYLSYSTLHVIRLQRCCSARVFPLSPFRRCWDIPTLKQHKSMRVSPTRKLSRIWCKSPTSLMASKTVSSINRLASVQSLLRGKRPVTPLPSRIIPTGRYGFFHIVPFLIPLLSVRMLPEQIAGNNQHKRKRHQLPYQDESFLY